MDELSPVQTPLPAPTVLLSVVPLLNTEPSLHTYTINGTPAPLLARDKELSTFNSNTVGFKVSYDFIKQGWRGIDRGTLNLAYDRIWFDYDDFRDLRVSTPVAGDERLYGFSADVVQFFVSAWF